MLREITVHYKKTSYAGSEVRAGKSNNILYSLDTGKVDIAQESILDRSERVLCDFFYSSLYGYKGCFL